MHQASWWGGPRQVLLHVVRQQKMNKRIAWQEGQEVVWVGLADHKHIEAQYSVIESQMQELTENIVDLAHR